MTCWRCKAIQPETFGDLVKFWREARSQREAAAACGLSAATLSRIESGELPDMKSFVALVQTIKVAPEFAFDLIRKQIAAATDADIEEDARIASEERTAARATTAEPGA